MTAPNSPFDDPRATLVHLHFIDPDTNDRSTWIGTSVSRLLGRDPQTGRRVLVAVIDVDASPAADEAPASVRAGDFEYGFENMDRGGEGPMMVGRPVDDIREQMALRRAAFPEVRYALRRRPVGRWETVEEPGPVSAPADPESAADRLRALIDQAATDGEAGDDTPILDAAGYTATFGDLREALAAAASATPASVWIYVDDDGTLSPVDYATRQVAQAHAEAAWRFVTEDDGPRPLSWSSAFADGGVQSEDAADFDLIDEDSGVRTGWQVRRIRVVDEIPEGVAGRGARA